MEKSRGAVAIKVAVVCGPRRFCSIRMLFYEAPQRNSPFERSNYRDPGRTRRGACGCSAETVNENDGDAAFNVGEHAWNHVHTRLSPTISPTRAIVRKSEHRDAPTGWRRREEKRINGERKRERGQVRELRIVFRHARIYLEIPTAK